MATEPTGLTMTFATTGFTGTFNSISMNIEVNELDSSHFGTTDFRSFVPETLKNGGELALGFFFNSDVDPNTYIGQDPETITVTWPVPSESSPNTTKGNWEFTGFIKGFDMDGAVGELMTGTLTVKVGSDFVYTASAA